MSKKSVAPVARRAPRAAAQRDVKGKPAVFASRYAFWAEVRRVAREELQRDFPHLTSRTFERWAKEYGPAEEPEAHKRLRSIRASLEAANKHLRGIGVVPDALEGPDRQLFIVLRELNMWPWPVALNNAEQDVGFRAHDLPSLRDRRSLVEEMLKNRGVQFTVRQMALTSIVVGHEPSVEWRDANVKDVLKEETRNIREQIRRLKENGSNGIRADIARVVREATKGAPRKK